MDGLNYVLCPRKPRIKGKGTVVSLLWPFQNARLLYVLV